MLFFKKKEYQYSDISLIDMLPVGSIIEINNSDVKYMIINYKGFERDKENKNLYKEIDYWCVPYPEGNTVSELDYIPVMQKDIKKVIFKGYDSGQRQQFLIRLSEGQEVR